MCVSGLSAGNVDTGSKEVLEVTDTALPFYLRWWLSPGAEF